MIREGIALGEVVAVFVAGEITVFVVFEPFEERIILAETSVVHIFVGFDARFFAIRSIHQRKVVVARSHAVPRLSSRLEIAEILVGELK